MSDRSARLQLPFIQPAQAQKHVTHNEALAALDAVVQASVLAMELSDPPADPPSDAIYSISDTPTGDWVGHAGEIAVFSNGGWMYVAPQIGWRAWDQQQQVLMVYEASGWMPVFDIDSPRDGIGIKTDWDVTNRLSVASDASLFSHEGAGHQLKLNKATASDTASLLYQSDYIGHAEMGLVGDNAFALKVSADGLAWSDALRIDPAAQTIAAPFAITGDAVQQAPDDTTPGRLMRADYGYAPGNVLGTVSQSAGVPTGAVIERGSNANGEFVRFACGTQICTKELILDGVSSETPSGALYTSGLIGNYSLPASFASIAYSNASMTGSDNARIRNSTIACRFGYFQTSAGNHWNGLTLSSTLPATGQPGEQTRFNFIAVGRWF